MASSDQEKKVLEASKDNLSEFWVALWRKLQGVPPENPNNEVARKNAESERKYKVFYGEFVSVGDEHGRHSYRDPIDCLDYQCFHHDEAYEAIVRKFKDNKKERDNYTTLCDEIFKTNVNWLLTNGYLRSEEAKLYGDAIQKSTWTTRHLWAIFGSVGGVTVISASLLAGFFLARMLKSK